VADELPASQLRDPCPGAAASRPALVHRPRPIHLPVVEPDQRRRPTSCSSSAQTSVPDGPDAMIATTGGTGRADVAAIPCARARRLLSASQRRPGRQDIERVPEKGAVDPPPCLELGHSYSSLGNSRLRTPTFCSTLAQAPIRLSRHDIRRQHIPNLVRNGSRRSTLHLTRCPARPPWTRATGATSAVESTSMPIWDSVAWKPIVNLPTTSGRS